MTTMTPHATATSDRELLKLEHDFWDAIKNRDARMAARLTAEDCTLLGASGVSSVDPRSMAKLLESPPYEIMSYRIDPQTTRITRLCDDAVAISYGVHEELEVDGRPVRLDAFDSSVWKWTDDRWACILHTESIAGDAFGRDRLPARQTG